MSNDSQKEVSLGFHKAVHFGFIPVILVSGFISLIISLIQNGEYAILDLISFGGILTLGIICFVGFFNWETYAWYSMQILVWFLLGNNCLVFLIYLAFLPDAIASVTPPVVYAILGVTVVRKYYIKLKPRFFPDTNQVSPADIQNNETLHSSATSKVDCEQSKSVCFCRKCGARAVNEALFCAMCGTKLDWRQ